MRFGFVALLFAPSARVATSLRPIAENALPLLRIGRSFRLLSLFRAVVLSPIIEKAVFLRATA